MMLIPFERGDSDMKNRKERHPEEELRKDEAAENATPENAAAEAPAAGAENPDPGKS